MAERKRGRPPLTESERKRRRLLTTSGRIFLGIVKQRLDSFKKRLNLTSHRETVAFLLNFYEENQNQVKMKLYQDHARSIGYGETTTSLCGLPVASHISHSPAEATSCHNGEDQPGNKDNSMTEDAYTGTTRIFIKPEPDDEQYLVKVEPSESPEATYMSHNGLGSETDSASEGLEEEDAVDEFVNFFKKDKTVPLNKGEDTANCNRPRSQRLSKKGYRVNYAAVEWNDSSSNVEAEDETKSEIDTDVDVASIYSGLVGADCTNKIEQKNVDHNNKQDSEKTKKLKECDKKSRKFTGVKRKRASEKDDPDFELTNEDLYESTVKPKRVSENKGFDYEWAGEEVLNKTTVSNKASENQDTEMTDEEDLNKSENFELKPKYQKLKKGMKNNFRKKNKRRKKNEVDQKPWVKISLSDHQDKYEIENLKSFEQQHRKSDVNEEVFSCLVCKRFKCSTKDVFESHLEQHVNKALECTYCQYSAFSRRDLSNHKDKCFDTRQSFICHICGVLSRTNATQKNHLGSAHNIPKWKCRLCEELFTSQAIRKVHIKEVHPDFYMQCPSCKKALVSWNKEDFQKHVETCKVIACEICGELLPPKQIARHLKWTHHRARTYSCDQCPYITKWSSKLKYHLLAHKGEHPYKCDQCNFSCVQSFNLKCHMRTHNGDKPYKCTECSYAAKWNVQLRDHVKLHSNPDGTKMCELCDVLFKNERVYRLHLKKEHQN